MKKKLIGYALGAGAALALAATAHAAGTDIDDFFGGGVGDSANFADAANLGDANLQDVIASVIKTILSFLGIVAVVIILMGGFQWMTAGGSEEKVKKAKSLITQGIIGLVITILAFAIATFVIKSITGAIDAA